MMPRREKSRSKESSKLSVKRIKSSGPRALPTIHPLKKARVSETAHTKRQSNRTRALSKDCASGGRPVVVAATYLSLLGKTSSYSLEFVQAVACEPTRKWSKTSRSKCKGAIVEST